VQSRNSVESTLPAPSRYQVDTSGLSTSRFAPPLTRHTGASSPSTVPGSRPPPPALPPRLPPRSTATFPSVPPPTSKTMPTAGILNQGALNRLGAAGVSVPALGIGRSSPPDNYSDVSKAVSPVHESKWRDLPTGLNRLNLANSPRADSNLEPTAPSGGTTFAKKKAAIGTAVALQNDPKSVSLKDARAAVGTLNNIRQRHGDQVSSGMNAANSFNQKHDVTGKLGAVSGIQTGHQSITTGASSIPQSLELAAKKKPPPPPPVKRKPDVAPPIPMNTRPQ
jgi:hypothetical protein